MLTSAHAPGFRYFLRFGVIYNLATTTLQTAPQNEIRNHMQVYRQMPHGLKEKIKVSGFVSDARIEPLMGLKSDYSVMAIKTEPMLINAGLPFTDLNCGPVTKIFLNRILGHPFIQKVIQKGDGDSIVVNTRVHMLMKGRYSNLSSWRSGAPFESVLHPNQEVFGPKAHYFFAFVSSKSTGVCQMEICPAGKTRSLIKDNQFVAFLEGTNHRCLPAHDSDWRLTMTVTVYGQVPENKIEKQVPSYLENINLSW